ncbi:MAG: cytochrome c [Pseudomonadales bacterium]|nr:cytochrome c [Pseudomonadales bacterium]MBO6563873.1 cytochrome c [Pseudomonadales bacterium]MBO6597420.1 cytochrome c [Pseudomonadales bacterium]MBO6658050.1 cytochrome c [Pseudomonadales bacterium]MBO6703085.1 cytochrome c [Pseudomonadales bacterium]
MKKQIVLLAALLLPVGVVADGKVETEYRQAVMKSIGGHMVSMGTILKNRVHFEDLALHARGLAALAEVAPNVFPDGSQTEKSKSLDSVWEDPEGFKAAMDKFVSAAQDMSAAAESGDMSRVGPAIQALGGSCKGCHDDYKAE